MSDAAKTRLDRTQAREFAIEAARLFHDRHCTEVLVLDVHGLSQVCDFIIIGTGTSDRQMKSLAGELEDLAAESGERVFRTNRDTAATWIVVDFVDVVAHLFEPNQRAYYDLEQLWSDATEVEWSRNGEAASAADEEEDDDAA